MIEATESLQKIIFVTKPISEFLVTTIGAAHLQTSENYVAKKELVELGTSGKVEPNEEKEMKKLFYLKKK